MDLFKRKNLKLCIFVFGIATIASTFLVFGYYAYPTPSGDSTYFLPPAVNLSLHRQFTSPFLDAATAKTDPTGQKRFIVYPPLFPVLLAAFMPSPTSNGVLIVLGMLQALTILVSGILFFKLKGSKQLGSWSSVFVILLALVAIATYLQYESRPDILARLFITCAVLVLLYFQNTVREVLIGIICGMLLSTTVVPTVLFALSLVIYYSIREKPRQALAKLAQIGLIGILTFLIIVHFTPFGIRDTLLGSWRQISAHLVLEPQTDVLRIYFLNPAIPFFGLILVGACIAGVMLLMKHHKSIKSNVLFILSAAFFCIVALSVFVKRDGDIHYFMTFSPILISGILLVFYEAERKRLKILMIAILLFGSVGFARHAILFTQFMKYGLPLATARHNFETYFSRKEGTIAIGAHAGMWTLSEDYDHMSLYSFNEIAEPNLTHLLLQQNTSGFIAPPEIMGGCTLSSNYFNRRGAPQIAGVKLNNTMPGYGFAIYECANKKRALSKHQFYL